MEYGATVPRISDNGRNGWAARDACQIKAKVSAIEAPIIAIAPAIANAVFRATGASVQSLPVRIRASVIAPAANFACDLKDVPI